MLIILLLLFIIYIIKIIKKKQLIDYMKKIKKVDIEKVNYWNGFLMMTEEYILYKNNKNINCYKYKEVKSISSQFKLWKYGPLFYKIIEFTDGNKVKITDNNCFYETKFNDISSFIKDKNEKVIIK